MYAFRCVLLAAVVGVVSQAAPAKHIHPEQPAADNKELIHGLPILFSVINNIAVRRDTKQSLSRESPFSAYTYSQSFWRDTSDVMLRNSLGAMAALRLDKKYSPSFGDISQLIHEYVDTRSTEKNGKSLPQHTLVETEAGDDPTLIEVLHLIQQIQDLRAELQRLIKINNALNFIEDRLDYLEEFLNHVMSDDADKIIKAIEKLIDDIQKEIEKYIKDLEKMLKDIKKWLDDMDPEDLEDLFWKLHWLIQNVEITDDGTIIIGDEEFDFEDLIVLCCPFG